MQFVLVSACLLGQPVRYHGGSATCEHPVLARWVTERRIVAVCPEMAGGLPTPRLPAEIQGGSGGLGVLRGQAQVIDIAGANVTAAFVQGAQQVLAISDAKNIRVAVLKEGSPSCGSGYTYDGTFSGGRAPVAGVTAALLQQAGIRVFSEMQFTEADEFLTQLDKG
jgi:uncharacterized protein YbbK (DUF523 family)